MSPGERRLIDFIERRIETMLHLPDVWGTTVSVEEGVLQLLELRHLLVSSESEAEYKMLLMSSYDAFIRTVVPGGTPEALAVQLERQGRSSEFGRLMKRFAEQALAQYVVEARQEAHPQDKGASSQSEVAAKLVLMLRAEAAANARRARRQAPCIVEFPQTGDHS